MADEPAGVSSLPAELTDTADEPIGASSLPTELLTHTLANTPPDSICAASAVSRHWQSGAAGCWPLKLVEQFGLAAAPADALRTYAVEHSWSRGRFSYAATPLSNGHEVAALVVDGAAPSPAALVATSDGSCLRVPLLPGPRVSVRAWKGNAGSPDAIRLKALHLRPKPAAAAAASHALTAVAACGAGAVFARGDELTAVQGWTAEAEAASAPAGAEAGARGGDAARAERTGRVSAVGIVPVAPASWAGAADGAWRPRVLAAGATGEVALYTLEAGGGGGGGATELLHVKGLRTWDGGESTAHACPALAVGAPGAGFDGNSCALVGSARGHVSVVDLEAGRVRGAILSSCARCPPLRLALFDHEARHLYAVTRRHHTTGSGHADAVTFWDARSLDKVGTCAPGGRSTKGEGVVGVHLDAHKLVAASAHGLISTFDLRTWRMLASRHVAALSPALSAVHCDGAWTVAGGGGLLHSLHVDV